jgi:hypothetical protein
MVHMTVDLTPAPPPIELVCLHALAGDTTSLCAAACVSREWHKAATGTASAWRVLAPSEKARGALTDARLTALAARACGGLESVDLRGARHVTNAGLLAALRPQAKLARVLLAGCEALTVAGVLAALDGKSALVTLSMNGLQADARQAERQLARIQALLPDAQTLDVSGVCTLLKKVDVQCARLISPSGKRFCAPPSSDTELRRIGAQRLVSCDACGDHVACALCAADFKECKDCGVRACALCAQSDGSALVECAHCHTVACDECLGGTAAFCESCSKQYCGACSKLADPAVVVQCARCENWCCAEPCAQDADMLHVCDGCPDDSDGEMVMMCEGCREMEDELQEEFGEWEF